MDFNIRLICGHISKDCIWIRFYPYYYGFTIKRTPPLFSERYGYVKCTPLLFGWRFKWFWDKMPYKKMPLYFKKCDY